MQSSLAQDGAPAPVPSDTPLSSWARRADGALGATVEAAAASLVLVEIAVLLAGVIARYVFHKPLVWSDELASILFLWLSMLGAVVALRRGEHMRMTGLVNRARPATAALLEALALTIPLLFLALVMWPAFEYAHEELPVVSPAMELSNAWRASAIPVGLGLMAVVALLRLFRFHDLRHIAIAVGATVAVGLAFWLLGPVLAPLGKVHLVIFFVILFSALVIPRPPLTLPFPIFPPSDPVNGVACSSAHS